MLMPNSHPNSFLCPRLLGFFVTGARCSAGNLVAWAVVVAAGIGLPVIAQAQEPPPLNPPAMALAIEDATINAIESVERSVVAIARIRRDREPAADRDPLRLEGAFAPLDSPDNPEYVPSLYGSGVVISSDGYIVTCAHVLDDPRQNDYYVWLDKQSYPARVVGRPAKVLASDPFSDLAVLKIDAINLVPMRLGDGSQLRKGQFVIALGNPQAIARDGSASASWGIVANLKRYAPVENDSPLAAKETIHQMGTLIQTDAKLNLGTSGGALVNLRGEMVGLTTSLAATSGYEQSAGYAIAVDDMFRRAVETLKLGKVPEYGFLGIQPEDLRDFERDRGLFGARISVVIPGLPGDEAGLRPEDIIFEVGDEPIHSRNDLFRELSQAAAGDTVPIRVQRFRPGTRIPESITLQARLSKKFVSSLRPGYAINTLPKWRGMEVEYATAIPSELARSGTLSGRRGAPKVAVLSVTPDSPAWKAGLRPGYGIQSVAGKPLESPDDFHQRTAEATGAVELVVVQIDGRSQTIVVDPEE